jgi:hypothetical protein
MEKIKIPNPMLMEFIIQKVLTVIISAHPRGKVIENGTRTIRNDNAINMDVRFGFI